MSLIALLTFGFIMILFGTILAKWSYKTARISEQLDSIGSKTAWSEVEPADWKVSLNKIFGIGMIIFGVILIATGLV